MTTRLMQIMKSTLIDWDVYVAPGIPVVADDLPPGQTHMLWSPTSSTLIYGELDAVLVDPLLTMKEAEALATWVDEHEKRLTTIYATHGHGDHWFGANTVLHRFPSARFVATPKVITVMREQASPETMQRRWHDRFPGQITDRPTIAESLDRGTIDLEGHELIPIDVGHTDTDCTTCLHVPDLGLVVAGDVVYNDVHVYLAESDHQKRLEWIAAVDLIEALAPRTVIAGHKRPGNDDDPRHIEATRQYIRDFDTLVETSNTANELYRRMLALYPDRVNRGALWLSATGVKRA